MTELNPDLSGKIYWQRINLYGITVNNFSIKKFVKKGLFAKPRTSMTARNFNTGFCN